MRAHLNIIEMYNILTEDVAFDESKFLTKARAVKALIDRGATEGERSAARLAMARLIDRAKDAKYILSKDAYADFLRRLTSIAQEPVRPSPKSPSPPPPPKQEPPRQQSQPGFVVIRYAGFREGTSDKVYGIYSKGPYYYTFWGRDGSTLARKIFPSFEDADAVFRSKLKKGYRERTIDKHIERYVAGNFDYR